ncbi:hypothetical protein BC835DRAFT_1234168, partial [Cytidiella melzeri]
WMVQQIHDCDDHALTQLQLWVNSRRWREATMTTLHELRTLSPDDASTALRELSGPRRFVKGHRGHQLDVPVTLSTLESHQTISLVALLDSGCTGSCIDDNFVRENNLPTKKLVRPIPVYNADGTFNDSGPIREYVECRLTVRDHHERILLAVTNLGRSKM